MLLEAEKSKNDKFTSTFVFSFQRGVHENIFHFVNMGMQMQI